MEEVTPENELTYRVDERLNREPPPPKSPKVAPKKSTKKKATVKRKKPTAKKQRPKQAAKPVAPAPPVYTLEELKEQGVQAKREIVGAVIEPAASSAGSRTALTSSCLA